MNHTARALFVGSFPPRQCGIATFTRDLVDSYDACVGIRSDVVAIDDRSGFNYAYGSRVVARLKEDDLPTYREAAARINALPANVVNVQHEYGLFGGDEGAWAVELLAAVRKPVVLTMHTVLASPSTNHIDVTRALMHYADRVVVLSETARTLLLERYGARPEELSVIQHGVPDVALEGSASAKDALRLGTRPIVSTFGLLSSGKGLEYAVAAIHEVAQRYPDVLYLLLGATHPNVRATQGERYRDALRALIAGLDLEKNVAMVDRYLSLEELLAYLQASDVYVTPYLNPDQVVSGTLAYALAAGKAIVSTPYLYARELLAQERGALAEFRDARSIAAGVIRFLDYPNLRARAELAAYAFGRRMTWPKVAAQYASVFASVAPVIAPVLSAWSSRNTNEISAQRKAGDEHVHLHSHCRGGLRQNPERNELVCRSAEHDERLYVQHSSER